MRTTLFLVGIRTSSIARPVGSRPSEPPDVALAQTDYASIAGRSPHLRLGAGWVCLLALVSSIQAQDTVILTEDTLPLPLARLPVVEAGPGTLFLVDFGFGTFEAPTPGELHDSLTLTLNGFSDGRERLLATVDVFGVTTPPLVEGTGNFTGSPIVVQERLAASILGLAWAHEGAYTLSFVIPGGWTGRGDLTGFLASNGDGLKSAGLLIQPRLVPEPGIVALTVAGGCLLLGTASWRCGGNRR